ncbi:MAG TPA: haloacid dehalogenase-like hydrolase [Acidimicrobiales bacterium]|nr:haloacid dehalogenase-like hydrolase [Acidimicrobiales bacterium]
MPSTQGPRPGGPRRGEMVALLDWDNTLHEGWTLDPWVRYLVEEGVAPPSFGRDTQRAVDDYLGDRIDHSELGHRVGALYAAVAGGWRTSDVADLAVPFLAGVERRVFPFVPALLSWLVDRGIEPVIVTGAPADLVVGYVEPAGGRVVGLTLAESDGRYTGAVRRNPVTADEKARVVAELEADGHQVVLGAGDTDSDLPLLRAARRQLVVGNPALAAEFPTTAMLVDPRTATGDEVCRGLERLLGV